MDGKSFDVKMDKLEKIKETIPEAFSEGKIDWEKLKAVLVVIRKTGYHSFLSDMQLTI